MMGINVRSTKAIDYAGLIVNGTKTLETRETNSLKPYIGKRVGIIRTGRGKAQLIGFVTIGRPIEVNQREFGMLFMEHLVPMNSEFDCKLGKTKFCYPLRDPQLHPPTDVDSKGIIARQISF